MEDRYCRKGKMVGGGDKTVTTVVLTDLFEVSRDTVRNLLNFSAINILKVLECDTQYSYLKENCRRKILNISRTEFGPNLVKTIIVVRELHGLNISGADFRFLQIPLMKWDMNHLDMITICVCERK